MRPVQNMSKRQRELTPLAFAEYLVNRVRAATGESHIAALFVRRDSVYRTMPGVECWGEVEDATRYSGPFPIVAHPPCGPWGYFSAVCFRQNWQHGRLAMQLVHKYGGVVEQPLGSQLFKAYGRKEAMIERVSQYDFGHAALKSTLLYWYDR